MCDVAHISVQWVIHSITVCVPGADILSFLPSFQLFFIRSSKYQFLCRIRSHIISDVDTSYNTCGRGQSVQAIKLFQIRSYVSDFQTLNNPGSWQPVYRRLGKLVLPSIFDTSLSSLMMWNLQSYPTTDLYTIQHNTIQTVFLVRRLHIQPIEGALGYIVSSVYSWMKGCEIFRAGGVKTYSDLSYIFLMRPWPPTPRMYVPGPKTKALAVKCSK